MSSVIALLRSRGVRLASVALAMMLLASPVLGVQAQWGGTLQAPIQAVSGAVLGTATFTAGSAGAVTVRVQANGFDPIAGSHRVAITNVGNCCAPYYTCAGQEVLVLPEMQFFANGSVDYMATANLNLDWLMRGYGAAIVIHADTNAASAVIGCGVIGKGASRRPK